MPPATHRTRPLEPHPLRVGELSAAFRGSPRRQFSDFALELLLRRDYAPHENGGGLVNPSVKVPGSVYVEEGAVVHTKPADNVTAIWADGTYTFRRRDYD